MPDIYHQLQSNLHSSGTTCHFVFELTFHHIDKWCRLVWVVDHFQCILFTFPSLWVSWGTSVVPGHLWTDFPPVQWSSTESLVELEHNQNKGQFKKKTLGFENSLIIWVHLELELGFGYCLVISYRFIVFRHSWVWLVFSQRMSWYFLAGREQFLRLWQHDGAHNRLHSILFGLSMHVFFNAQSSSDLPAVCCHR